MGTSRSITCDGRKQICPRPVPTKQAELAKRDFEATVKNTRGIAELVQ